MIFYVLENDTVVCEDCYLDGLKDAMLDPAHEVHTSLTGSDANWAVCCLCGSTNDDDV